MRIDRRVRKKSRRVRQLCRRQSTKRKTHTRDIPLYLRGAYRRRAVFAQRTQRVSQPFSRARFQSAGHPHRALRTRRDTPPFRQRLDSHTRKHIQNLRRGQLYRALRLRHRRRKRDRILYRDRLLFDDQGKKIEIRDPRISVFLLPRRDIRLSFVQIYLISFLILLFSSLRLSRPLSLSIPQKSTL